MSHDTSADHDLIREISPAEKMFPSDRSEDSYFKIGRSALDGILLALKAAHKPHSEIQRILDLPCGHGRVLRHLHAEFPAAEITACDLLTDGVDYCAKTFGAKPVYSDEDPSKITVESNYYDLIWVGSLLTHLDEDLWTAFLNHFRNWLQPGGVLVFTTHGRELYRSFSLGLTKVLYRQEIPFLHAYEQTGFAYINETDPPHRYGTSLTSPQWVVDQLTKLPEMRIVYMCERGWEQRQAIFACQLDSNWEVQPTPVSKSDLAKFRREENRKTARARRANLVERIKSTLRPVKHALFGRPPAE